MKKKKTTIITCVFVIICIIGIISINIHSDLPENPSKEKLVSFFQNNKDTFDQIATYLTGIERNIFLRKSDGKDVESIGKIQKMELSLSRLRLKLKIVSINCFIDVDLKIFMNKVVVYILLNTLDFNGINL